MAPQHALARHAQLLHDTPGLTVPHIRAREDLVQGISFESPVDHGPSCLRHNSAAPRRPSQCVAHLSSLVLQIDVQAYCSDNLLLPDYRERWFGRPIIKNPSCDVLHRIIVRVGLGNQQISSDLGARTRRRARRRRHRVRAAAAEVVPSSTRLAHSDRGSSLHRRLVVRPPDVPHPAFRRDCSGGWPQRASASSRAQASFVALSQPNQKDEYRPSAAGGRQEHPAAGAALSCLCRRTN